MNAVLKYPVTWRARLCAGTETGWREDAPETFDIEVEDGSSSLHAAIAAAETLGCVSTNVGSHVNVMDTPSGIPWNADIYSVSGLPDGWLGIAVWEKPS